MTSAPPLRSSGKYLIVRVGRDFLGIHLLKVREIIRVPEFSEAPYAPRHLRGMCHHRGKIIPLFDLRTRLSAPDAILPDRTCLVIVAMKGKGGATMQAGLIVDAVAEVSQIQSDNLIPEEETYGAAADWVLAQARVGDRTVTIADLELLVQESSERAVGATPTVEMAT